MAGESGNAGLFPAEKVSGNIEHVVFHSEDTGFSVLRVAQGRWGEPATVVGVLGEPREGEWIEAEGRWTVDRTHGKQFKADTLRTAAPNTPEGIERYLASGLIKGIGPELAGRLVRTFGSEVMDVIEKSPERLRQVPGVGKKKLASIRKAWGEKRAAHDVMVFLHSCGVSTGQAHKIYKTYGQLSGDVVRANPYRLSQDVDGIGFKSADAIAAKVGIERTSPLRARAGVEHVLVQLTDDGHCAYPRPALVQRASELLDIPAEGIDEAIAAGVSDGRLTIRAHQEHGELVYLAWMDRTERYLAAALLRLAGGKHPCPAIDAAKAVPWAEKQIGLTLAAGQRRALELATRSKVMVVTGGPGVGKTTLLNAILKVLRAKDVEVALCAPTGRAAKRLSETTGLEAKTIHRLLGFDPKIGGFRSHEGQRLETDVVVVDETSMVDLPLAWSLVQAVPDGAALLLVGDVDQLPSVGPGCVLRDVIESGRFPVVRLTEVFRQAASSRIITSAHQVNQGRMPALGGGGGSAAPGSDPTVPGGRLRAGAPETDFYFVKEEDPAKAVETIVKLIKERIPRRFGFDPMDDVQVITPMQRGDLGTWNLNQVLQQALNDDPGPALPRSGVKFRPGDKVMQIVNNYEKEVFNGDIGRIEILDVAKAKLVVRFDKRSVPYEAQELDQLVLSYAITIHKSQGSEYPVVIVPMHTQHYVMLQRNLLYTAITRSRKLVVLVGTEQAIGTAVRRADTRKRVTTLRERLTDGNSAANAEGTNGNNAAKAEGTSGNSAANAEGTSGNNAANAEGTNGNNAANAEGTSGNNAANAEGTNGNSAANAEGTNGNNAANAEGTNGNNAANAEGTEPGRAAPVGSEPGTAPAREPAKGAAPAREPAKGAAPAREPAKGAAPARESAKGAAPARGREPPLAYHISFGTYGVRIHGDIRFTVDRRHNTYGEPFIERDDPRSNAETEQTKFPPIFLTREQRLFVEEALPSICDRGGWKHVTSAAGPDHVHVVLSTERECEKVRNWLKRWLGEALTKEWRSPASGTWWAEGGSIKWVWGEEYLGEVIEYVRNQRATR
jgi:exodeoxyribonuclease V alpha subunit